MLDDDSPTPASKMGGQRSSIASDHQAQINAENNIVTQETSDDISHTSDNLHSLNSKRVGVDLTDGILLMFRCIEALQPEVNDAD